MAAKAGEELKTVEELIEFNRTRKGKSLSNQEWESPTDPDARVAKRKDRGTDMAHQAEHAVDLESGALLGVTVQGAELGDTQTLGQTLAAAHRGAIPFGQEGPAEPGPHSRPGGLRCDWWASTGSPRRSAATAAE